MKRAKPDERRYHDDARKALQWANQITIKFNHDHLGSEHLLGGLLHDDTGAAARLLRDLGADPRGLKKKLLEALVPGADMVTSSRVPRTPCLARAIECAGAAADELGHPEVDARHLLLGLASGDGLAADTLRQAGVTAESLRSRIGGPGRSQVGDAGQGPAGNGAGSGR